MASYPIASMADGGVKYSDGSIKYASYGGPNSPIQAIASTPSGYPVYSSGGSVLGTSTSNQSSGGGGGAPKVQQDANTYDPNNLSGWGMNFGSDKAAYDAYAKQMELGPQIDAVYGPQEDYLNQTEQFYKNQLPGYQQEANTNYDVNKQLLGTSLKNANTTLDTQQTQGQRATEDALAKARRIFQEQQIGNQQRFGGSSSAGGAMSELLGRNLQSEMGQTQRQAVDYTQQIGQLRQQTQQKFDDSLLQLEQQKQKSLNDIQREFDQKMLEITNNRTQLTSAKAQMKLQALMDLRNQTFAVQQQATQFQQALALQKQAADAQTQQYASQAQGYGTTGAGNLSSLQTNLGNQSYGLSVGGQAAPQQSQYIGQIGKSVTGKDEQGRTTYSDGTAGWTQWQ